MKLAVIGSRNFHDAALLQEILLPYLPDTTLVISGGAKGVDTLAENWARENGIEVQIFPADWARYGRGAGRVRNHDIIQSCDQCIAFWDGNSKGTKHSIDLCKKYRKHLRVVEVGRVEDAD